MAPAATAESDSGLPVLSLLDEARALRLGFAVERLREVQSLAGVYAAMVEGHAFTADDLVNMDAVFAAATRRAGEALFTLGATLTSEGIA